jgi:hypothetical protein
MLLNNRKFLNKYFSVVFIVNFSKAIKQIVVEIDFKFACRYDYSIFTHLKFA